MSKTMPGVIHALAVSYTLPVARVAQGGTMATPDLVTRRAR